MKAKSPMCRVLVVPKIRKLVLEIVIAAQKRNGGRKEMT